MDVKYVIVGKQNRDVDAYVAPYIQPVKPGIDFGELQLMVKALKLKSGFEWKIVLRDIDADNKFIPVEFDDNGYDRELPILSMELFQYTRAITQALRDGKLPAYNRDHIDGRTPAVVYAMLLTCNVEYHIVIPVDVYIAFEAACREYYGDYNTLPWGIKRSIAAHTQQFHIRLCDDGELTYARCMAAKRTNEIKISPIMDCRDVNTTLRETAKFGALVAASFERYSPMRLNEHSDGAKPTPETTPKWSSGGQRLGDSIL